MVERKVGLSLQGISCTLLTGGFPNVFWPMIGHAFVVNYTLSHKETDGMSSYEKTFGDVTFEPFIPGELVFFMPAPTIVSCKPAKVESNLVAGIFLDYYMGPDGKFTGQYIYAFALKTSLAKAYTSGWKDNISSYDYIVRRCCEGRPPRHILCFLSGRNTWRRTSPYMVLKGRVWMA